MFVRTPEKGGKTELLSRVISSMNDNTREKLRLTHTREAIRKRLEEGAKHSYLRDLVYGAVDGAVTTFAVVSGAAGANLSSGIVVIMGLANLAGDGFSMAVGNFLGTRAEEGLRSAARKREEFHIEAIPEGEREEIRQIFASKGFRGKELEKIVGTITSDKKQWIDTMLKEELGMALENPSPWKAAFFTFAAFILVGFLPLVSFLFQFAFPYANGNPFFASALLTGLAFFVVGAFKGRFIGEPWPLAGLGTLLMGGSAAALAFGVGLLLRNLVSMS